MSKEKQIEEMIKIAFPIYQGMSPDKLKAAISKNFATFTAIENLYNANYRRQNEVIDEFAKLLKEEMNNLSRMEYHCAPYFLVSKDFVDKIAAKMKGGAE